MNKSLDNLDICGNKLYDVTGQRILNLLSINTNIKRIKARMNAISNLEKIKALLKRNRDLSKIIKKEEMKKNILDFKSDCKNFENINKNSHTLFNEIKKQQMKLDKEYKIYNTIIKNKDLINENYERDIKEIQIQIKQLDEEIIKTDNLYKVE